MLKTQLNCAPYVAPSDLKEIQHPGHGLFPHLKNFREINLQYNSLVISYFDEIFAKKSWYRTVVKFCNFQSVRVYEIFISQYLSKNSVKSIYLQLYIELISRNIFLASKCFVSSSECGNFRIFCHSDFT